MSDTPFEAPADEKGSSAPPPPHARPRSLLVVAALSAALGVFGLLGTLFACFGSAVSLGASGAFTVGMSPEQAAAQSALMEASRPFVFVQLALLLAVIPLAVALLLGGINVLAEKPAGIDWLRNAFLFGLVVEPVRLLAQVAQLIYLWDLTLAASAAAAAPSAGLPPGSEEMMTGVVIGSVVLGQVVTFAWFLCKMALYGFGRRVIAGEATQEWILSKT